MRRFSDFAKAIIRFLVLWVVDGFSLLVTAALYAGINFLAPSTLERIVDAFAAAFLLGIVNLLIRPLILLISRPLGFIAVFLIGFIVNALALLLTSALLPAFEVTSLGAGILGGIIFSAINVLLTGFLEVEDEGSFYQGVIERLARRDLYPDADSGTPGLVMLEIDGLSYHHLKHALEKGYMPTMQRLIKEEGYQIARIDCGIPSQTSACQAGIMFGDNHDIPAFRWYDKDEQKLYVSGNDAALLNARYANGNGLMRGGASVNNMLNGDAHKSLLTLADLRPQDPEQRKQRAEDVYLLLLNPYFLTRTIVFFLVDVGREVWQGWQQRRKNVYPRLNRLKHAYPFVRAATTVFMRDIAANLTVLDIIRGAPSIYVTWPGYDEVAHHSGPWTDDAFKVLATYDKVIARVHETIQEKAPRPYDLVILSDHGQSFGPTFLQRYGVSLKEFIEQQLPQGTRVAQAMGGDTGVTSLTAVHGELDNIQQSRAGGATGRAVARQAQKAIRGSEQRQQRDQGDTDEEVAAAEVVAYGSGNLAQVYFDLYPRKITLAELNSAYPGMVDALIQHEGIGLVCGYLDDGTPVALSKTGQRNLHTGEITGEDPLVPYAPDDPHAYGAASVEVREWQVRRVMDFPHAGDLMVISTVYPDGTVAALEELIGNHGGLGGEQTDAFLFHPPDLEVRETRNSIDVYHILNAHRDRPAAANGQRPLEVMAPPEDQWSAANLWAGLKDVGTWVTYAGQALALRRKAYGAIARDKRMTGPALLLGLTFSALGVFLRGADDPYIGALLAAAVWPIEVLLVYGAARLISRKGYYTRTMRAMGFAHVATVLGFLALVPQLEPLAFTLVTLVSFITFWLAAAEAHETRGWRTLILPLVALAAMIVVPLVLVGLLGGAVVSIQSVLEQLGFISP